MKYFVMSDIHIDFFLDLWESNNEWGFIKTAKELGTEETTKVYENCIPSFEKFYELHMEPADALIFAGDCSNDYYTQVNFYKFLATKYANVYIVFGNHDLGIGRTFGNGNPFKYTEDKIADIEKQFKDDKVIHIMNGNVLNDVGGTMGMCDLHYSTMYDMGIPYRIKQWQKSWYDSKVWHIKTPKWRSGYKINPIAILEHEKQKLNEIVSKQPKIIMTHFCPSELGVAREFERSSSTAFFYFDAKKFLDQLDHETWWFCGHIHNIGHCDYTNEKGHIIHIWAMPNGYPGENPYCMGAFEKTIVGNDYTMAVKTYLKTDRTFEI